MKQHKLEKQVTTYFDHNFFKSKRIDFRFCTLAKLEKLNNFPTDRPEVDVTKKVDFPMYALETRGYLARARARARARPALASAGASGPYPEGIVNIL